MANRVILTGRLGADPKVHQFDDGMLANARLATSEHFRDKASGEMRELTEWHRLVFNGRLAEVARDYLVKGSRIYIEGCLRTRKWQAQDGGDRYSTEIVVQRLEMMGGRKGGNPAEGGPGEAEGPNDEWTQAYDNATF